MSTVIATYYPSTTLIVTTTPMNMKETSPSTLYETPIPGRVIVKCDIFAYLSKYFGKSILKVRPHLYTIFSHARVSDKDYCAILAHCYRRYAAFANLIDEQYYFGDETLSLQQRITDKLISLTDEARLHFNKYNGKLLMENEGYLYYAFNEGCAPTDLLNEEGVMTYV